MAATNEPSPYTISDQALGDMVAVADLPSLLATLAHVCGSPGLIGPELRLDGTKHHEPQGGWTLAQQADARARAVRALAQLRDAGWPTPPRPTAETVRPIMTWMMDTHASDDYIELLLEELGDPSADLRAPDWRAADIASGRTLRVAVIGAGMSGLLAAYRLRQVGIDVELFEKNSEVGGTWLENVYPGCRVDVASHLYCYSFAQRDDWPQHFSTQAELLAYFRGFAVDHGLMPLIRFSTRVESVTFDDDSATWTVHATAGGRSAVTRFDAVVNATGQLNRPKLPDIPGLDTFAGPTFHSAEWDRTVDLAGKRVAVIGTGASAAQFIPIIAEQAAQVLVMQRTPNWLAPTLDYHDDFPDGQRWLLTHLPYCSQWYRFWLFWRYAEGILPSVKVDPEWHGDGHSVSAANEELRMQLGMYLGLCFGDRPDLLSKVMPDYPPAAKRILRDNGIWATTLKRDNVALITEPIAAIEPQGLRMVDGALHEVDVIIFGTGFQASKFLTPIKVTGRNNIDLHQQWDGDARAYLGIVVPNFPNFFILYGPNTNIVVNGSIIYFSECEVHYVLQCLRYLLQTGAKAIDCLPAVHDKYNARIDEGNRSMAWGASTVNSWYKSDSGRVAQNWPFSLLEFWQQTREVESADYELI
ncbi:MAG TPA: NAD(P)/FAD-dependent oxidoreductase [Ilumatobacteraceae bacterium]|nr:NAD(P)/FAD-dependent oxidoreductase [Ilumatobacteraceae bacterium]